MWKCDICGKKNVEEKKDGFRVFVEYRTLSFIDLKNKDREKIECFGRCRRQIRICNSCLKKDLETLRID